METSLPSETVLATSVVPPLSKQFEITVAFSPKVDQELNTLLLLRNNLTVYDYIIVQGAGVQGVFAIDGIQPGTDPLKFEFASTVIESCQSKLSDICYRNNRTRRRSIMSCLMCCGGVKYA